MKLSKERIENIKTTALNSTAPPTDEFKDAASLIVYLDNDNIPQELYPTDIRLKSEEVLNPDQLQNDLTLFANARTFILQLLSHVQELENDQDRLARVVKCPSLIGTLPEHLQILIEGTH